MGPIFNEKVVEKWNLWVREQCTNALFTVEKLTSVGWTKKKKKKRNLQDKNADATIIWIQTGTICFFFLLRCDIIRNYEIIKIFSFMFYYYSKVSMNFLYYILFFKKKKYIHNIL